MEETEIANDFLYLGSLVNKTNYVKDKINKIIQNANICYCAMIKFLKSKLLTHETKINLLTTLIKLTLTYDINI